MTRIMIFTNGDLVALLRQPPTDAPWTDIGDGIVMDSASWRSLCEQVREGYVDAPPLNLPVRRVFHFANGTYSTTAFTSLEWHYLFETIRKHDIQPVRVAA